MCLDTVDAETKDVGKFGYKVFTNSYGLLYPLYYNRVGDLPTGEWITDVERKSIRSGDDKTYLCGFHYFPEFSDADKYCAVSLGKVIMKIEVREVVATGMQEIGLGFKLKCAVAKEIFIITDEEVNEDGKD